MILIIAALSFFSNRAYEYTYHKTQRFLKLLNQQVLFYSEDIRQIKHHNRTLCRSFNGQFLEFRFGVIVIPVLYYIIQVHCPFLQSLKLTLNLFSLIFITSKTNTCVTGCLDSVRI